MKKLLVILFLSFSVYTFSQIHNRMIKFNVGVSKEQFGVEKVIQTYNDTSSNQFEFKTVLPVLSISEEFVFNDRFSLGATIGYQYFNINYNQNKYGYNLFFATVNPQLSVFYRKGFEYYVKLKAGMIYRNGDLEIIPFQSQRYFPQKTNLVTGLTVAGFNFFIHDDWSLNAEFSIWSPEWINVGIAYRFFKGIMPKIEDDGYFTD